MSSPLTTDFKAAVAIIIAGGLVATVPIWVFLFPAITPPQELVTFATLALQFLFGLAGSTLAVKSYRAAKLDDQ